MYKYCLVPKCTNTTIKTPDKLFFSVPKDTQVRKKWCHIMKRDDKTPLSSQSTLHCCEDHFDIEVDMENYVKFKLAGGNIKLRKGVVPHKFDCQKPAQKKVERPGFEKRQRIEYFERVLSKDIGHENLILQPIEVIDCESENLCNSHNSDPLHISKETGDYQENTKLPCKKSQAVQVTMKHIVKTKSTNTPLKWKQNIKKNTGQNLDTNENNIADDMCSVTSNSFSTNATDNVSSDSEYNSIINTEDRLAFEQIMNKGALMAVSREPKLLIGIPYHSYFCIKLLQEFTGLLEIKILVTLRKIRCHESNFMLAIHFGVSESSVSKYVNEAVPKIALCMKELILFPPVNEIRQNLPISFRKRYSKATAIIDCFEIEIEKPSNATHQALTWSQYKNCNTIKYLISITPDGLINFISEGYGGRTPDSTIFEDSGFLNKLTEGTAVLADRGFKNIAHLLQQRGCMLLRPPSVSANTKPTAEEVLQTKRIAALRVHVERSIGKLRDFKMIGTHACVDISYIKILDFIVKICCGIVNLQDCLFSQ